MAVRDRGCHLAKQTHCLILLQPLAGAHVRVHVSIVTFEEYVHIALPEHHLWNLADVAVWKQSRVGCDELVILLNRKHLLKKYQNKMVIDPPLYRGSITSNPLFWSISAHLACVLLFCDLMNRSKRLSSFCGLQQDVGSDARDVVLLWPRLLKALGQGAKTGRETWGRRLAEPAALAFEGIGVVRVLEVYSLQSQWWCRSWQVHTHLWQKQVSVSSWLCNSMTWHIIKVNWMRNAESVHKGDMENW